MDTTRAQGMARRRRTTTFEEFMSLAALLPCRGSFLVALVSCFLLHGFATSTASAMMHSSKLPAAMTGTVLRSLAIAGQFLIMPALLGAVGSYWERAKRKKLFKDAVGVTQPAGVLYHHLA